MLEEHEKHGDTYAQYGGGLYTIITRDPVVVREILARQFKHFDTGAPRAGCLKPLIGSSVFTQDGKPWDHSRKLLAPLIKRPDLAPFPVFEKHFQILLSQLQPATASASASPIHLDLKAPLFDLTFSVITEFLLGPAASTSSTEGRAFADAFNTAFRWISRRERLKALYWVIDGLEFRSSCRRARSMVEDMIRRTQQVVDDAGGMERRIALFRLMRDGESDVGEVRDHFLGLLLAGRDTSGSLLCWCIYVLAREPGVWDAAQEEVRRVLDGRRPTKEDLGAMKVLDGFMCEVLRLFPPVPINGRICNTDTTLPRGGGPNGDAPILCPKDTLICFSAYAVQTNKALWDKADRFDIDRWAQERSLADRITDWSYQPFIGGPRKCLGETFALEESKYMVCRFLQQFSSITAVQPNGQDEPPDVDWVDKVRYHVGLTMSPDDGVWVKLVPT
ncbi:putative P450 monooxygenase [Polyplosphaeria fusca]|uniref:P450 monooxygenase n=1 Tax=Polyplosphaeria fusca TaxID=682080 RepID=A0A9P4QLA2_9PLEO|nr:putative P450 monooxygenase [Polyplosphaeria fusca]